MRMEQTKLKERFDLERNQIVFQNERLMQELQELQETAVQICVTEAEVAMLAKEYEAHLQLLGQEKEHIMRNYMLGQHGSTIGNEHRPTRTAGPNTLGLCRF